MTCDSASTRLALAEQRGGRCMCGRTRGRVYNDDKLVAEQRSS